jgi:hypothetical protein
LLGRELNILGEGQNVYRREKLAKTTGKENFHSMFADCHLTKEEPRKGVLVLGIVQNLPIKHGLKYWPIFI